MQIITANKRALSTNLLLFLLQKWANFHKFTFRVLIRSKKKQKSVFCSFQRYQHAFEQAQLAHQPATVGDLLLTKDFKKPKRRAAYPQVINVRMLLASVHQIDARVALEKHRNIFDLENFYPKIEIYTRIYLFSVTN